MTPPVAINGVSYGKVVNGVTAKQALSAANSTVSKGVYDATLLETVDADLAVGNIINTATIFGKVGTAVPGGTETISKYADATIANGATYTPADSGLFFNARGDSTWVGFLEYYSTVAVAWYSPQTVGSFRGANAIGDGTNFRIRNGSGGDQEYCLMRHYYSVGTYTREVDQQLAGGASWTPATTGFFATGSQTVGASCINQIAFTTAGWSSANDAYAAADAPLALAIGDGTNFRILNNSGGNAVYHVTMRAKLT